jgi:DNA-directed RNA polymerase specialized sigma24 family protein
VQAESDAGSAPCAAISTAAPSPAGTEATLRQAHVYVARYYRAWLAGTAGGEALAEALAVEALVRIARLPAPPDDYDDTEQIAAWLSVAHGVAREVVEG